MSARSALRDGTRAEHERVDRLFGRLDLTAPLDYRLFLIAQAAAFLPVEAALEQAGVESIIPDWSERRRSQPLRDDLAALEAPLPAFETAPELAGASAILGAVYVVEGSRLGGAMLRRGLADSIPQSFLRHSQGSGAWRKLLETLDHSLYETAALDTALRAARAVFGCFETAGRRILEYRAT